ncbi:MAG: low molecular weight protein-tyrosine-phosphatase [Pseudomonadota bacterium]
MVGVLFVCLGNICRSPAAEGVFSRMADAAGLQARLRIDSAGTGAWHVGQAPDARMIAAARARGIDLRALRARQVRVQDFHDFDYLLAMDRDNLRRLHALAPAGLEGKARLFLSFAAAPAVHEVPDPYYGGPQGFEEVLDLIDAAARGLLAHLRATQAL